MAFGEEKRKRKNIKLVKGAGAQGNNFDDDWAMKPPDAEEVDELLDDLEDVLKVTTGVSDDKEKKKNKLFQGCAPSVRVSEKDLKEALKAMSTPVGEAPRGLGGIKALESGSEEKNETETIIPSEIRPNYRMALKLSIVSAVFFLCLMCFSYFFFKFSFENTLNQLKKKWMFQLVNLKKGEIKNSLFFLEECLRPNKHLKSGKRYSVVDKKFDGVVSLLPEDKEDRSIFVLWAKDGSGQFKVVKKAYIGNKSKLLLVPLMANGEKNPATDVRNFDNIVQALNRVSGKLPHGYEQGVLKIDRKGTPVVYGLKKVTGTNRILGCFASVGTEEVEAMLKVAGFEYKYYVHIVVDAELVVFLLILSFIWLYNWKRNRAVYKLGHHIDLMALGDLEQKIEMNTGDDLDFIGRKLATMQASFLGAISRLRRRRNV